MGRALMRLVLILPVTRWVSLVRRRIIRVTFLGRCMRRRTGVFLGTRRWRLLLVMLRDWPWSILTGRSVFRIRWFWLVIW